MRQAFTRHFLRNAKMIPKQHGIRSFINVKENSKRNKQIKSAKTN